MTEQRKQELISTLQQKIDTDSEALNKVIAKAEDLLKDIKANAIYDDNLVQRHEEEFIETVAKGKYLSQKIKMHQDGIKYAQNTPAENLHKLNVIIAMTPNDFIWPQ